MNIRELIRETLETRYACKKFDPEKRVSDEDFDLILDSGRMAASSFGMEPWKFLIIENKSLKEKLHEICWGGRRSLEGGSHYVILLARKQKDMRYDSEYILHMMRDVQHVPAEMMEQRLAVFEDFQKNGLKLLESERATFDWASKQTYIAMANMIQTAAMLGIDSCPVEGFDRAAVDRLLSEEGIMDPNHFGVSVMIGFGYRMEEIRPKTRQPREDVIEVIR